MTGGTAFNLIDDPWLPVRYAGSDDAEVGLRVALRDAPAIRDLAIAFPLEYVATLRMVIAVLQSACGPTTMSGKPRWLDAHAEMQPSIERYFDTWHEGFELFHPSRPFMQAPIGPEVEAGTIAALRPDWASGNNATLFDHHIDRRPEALSAGAAARALLTTLLFQPGGGVSRPFNRTDSPATKALQVLVEGRDLWETLVVNAPSFSDHARPIWEWSEHDDERARREGTTPCGWLDRATWRSRAIQLLPDEGGRVSQVRMHQHLKLSDAPPFDPYAPIRRVEGKPPTPVRASPSKALWRDAEALLGGLRESPDHPTVVAEAVEAFEQRDESWLPRIRIVGQVVSQAKVTDVRDGRMPVSRALLEDPLHLRVVVGLVDTAETGAKALRRAIHDATTELGAADGWGRAARWETDYWAVLAAPFRAALEDLAAVEDVERIRVDVVDSWREQVIAGARRVFDRFGRDGASGRAPRALGMAQATLDRGLIRLRSREDHPA